MSIADCIYSYVVYKMHMLINSKKEILLYMPFEFPPVFQNHTPGFTLERRIKAEILYVE